MNYPLVTNSFNKLRIDLRCREIAIRLSAANLLEFIYDETSQEPMPALFCLAGYLPGILDPVDAWHQVDWAEMPLLAELYIKFGDAGLYFWSAWRRDIAKNQLVEIVQQIYTEAELLVLAYLNQERPALDN
jgi:hypothetical protein